MRRGAREEIGSKRNSGCKKIMQTSDSTDVGTGSICKFRMPIERHNDWDVCQEYIDDSTDKIMVVHKPKPHPQKKQHHPR